MFNKSIKLGIFLSLAFIGVSASIPKNVSFNSQVKDNATTSINQNKSITNGKNVFWTNPDPAGLGPANWNGVYRFGLDGHDSLHECLTTFPQEIWDKIKNGTFYINFAGSDWIQMRITTGWWSTTWTGADICTGDERIILNEDGTYTLEINFTGDPIQELLDQQHLLFTGGGYTPLSLYTEGGPEPPAEEVVWENDGSLPTISWSGQYRFSNVEHSTGEECYAFPMNIWERLKTETFYIDVDNKDNIRVTTGWWSVDWPSSEYNNADDLVYNEEKRVWTLEINFAGHNILDLIDAEHLLFTGQGYKVLRIYFKGEEPEPEPYHVLWDNDYTYQDPSWGDDYRFGYVGGASPERCLALFSEDEWNDVVKNKTFYMDLTSPNNNPRIRVADGWWTKTWTGDDIIPGNQYLAHNIDGTWTLKITLTDSEIVDYIDERNLMITGQDYTPTRIYYGDKPKPSKEAKWQNNDSHEVQWDSKYLFSNIENPDPVSSECCYLFSMEDWERLKNETFYLVLQSTDDNNLRIRIVDGAWSTVWTGDDITPGNSLLSNNGDGTWTLKINFANDAILNYIDNNGLLFTGQSYVPSELYFVKNNSNHLINNEVRQCTSFKNNAYLSTDNDSAKSGDVVTITANLEKEFEFTTNDIRVTYGDGQTCELTEVGDYVYTFIMPGDDVNITASFDTDYIVTFIMIDFEVLPIDPIVVHAGSKIKKPVDPSHIGQTFVGWYKENTGTHQWDFDNDIVEGNTSLFTKWEENPDPVISLALKSSPTKVEYKLGEELDLRGGKVTATMESGAIGDYDITPDLVSGYDKNKIGKQTITLTYSNLTVTFNVTVVDYAISIAMKSNPTKVQYKFGEDLNLAGAKITANMASGAVVDVDVTSDMVSGYDKNKSGEQVITITYQGHTTTFVVTVLPAPVPVEVRLDIILPTGGALVLIILVLLTTYFVNKKKNLNLLNALLPDNVECTKIHSADDRFDEYVFEYSYKDRQMSYFMYKLKTLNFSKADAKKEFIQLIRKGKIRRYSNKYYRQMKRLGC